MNKLSIDLRLQVYIPDDWEIHETFDGVEYIKTGEGRYLDLSLESKASLEHEDKQHFGIEADIVAAILSRFADLDTKLELKRLLESARPHLQMRLAG